MVDIPLWVVDCDRVESDFAGGLGACHCQPLFFYHENHETFLLLCNGYISIADETFAFDLLISLAVSCSLYSGLPMVWNV